MKRRGLTALLLCAPALAQVHVLSYFRKGVEALHLAYSRDGLAWTALNGNRPVLRATLGNRSIRDPFIRRGPDGWFHLVSTDSWASRNILHWRSRDLVRWEDEALLPVMGAVPEAHNAWAPEFYYDEARKEYFLYWSSAVGEDKRSKSMWCAWTRDFRSVSAPRMFFNPGYTVIDGTIEKFQGRYYMVFKDERGTNTADTQNKAMRVVSAAALEGPYAGISGLVTPTLTEGPALLRDRGIWRMYYDAFAAGKWGAAESGDLREWRDVTPRLRVPEGARHGSVFGISGPEFERLLRAPDIQGRGRPFIMMRRTGE